MTRPLVLLVALLAVLAVLGRSTIVLADAKTGDRTWCVGGFRWADANNRSSSSTVADGCQSEQKNRNLPSWHKHYDFVTNDNDPKTKGKCYQCWDLSDNTCSSEGSKVGWRQATLDECRTLGPASPNDKTFIDPDKKWAPQDDPIVVIPVAEPPFSLKPPDRSTTVRQPPRPPDVAVQQPPVQQPPVQQPPVQQPPDTAVQQPPVQQPPDTAIVQPPRTPTTPTTPARPSSTPVTIALAVRVSPGPYAINDPVTMTGAASANGTARGVSGGFFEWFGPDGQPVPGPDGKPYRIPGKPGPQGTVVATAPVPIAGAVTLRFSAGGVQLRGSERPTNTADPATVSLDVAQCRLRGVVLAPTDGELIAASAKAELQLRGRFDTTAGAASTELGGATAVFVVDIDGTETRVPATVTGGEVTGTLSVEPPETDVATVAIRLLGDGGGRDVCPGATATAQLTRLGLALEVKGTRNCYVGMPCPIEARFKFPRDPATRAAAEKLATAPDLAVALRGSESLTAASPGDPNTVFTGTFVPESAASAMTVEVVAGSKAQGREITGTAELRIREPIELKLPAELDLGTVDAGSSWPAGCKELDFSASRGVLEESFTMKSTLPKGCKSTPALLSNGLGTPLPAGLEVTIVYSTRTLKICLAEVPRCAEENPEPVELTITPTNPDFADRAATLKVKWRVRGRSFLACHWWWIAAALGAIGLLAIGYGFVKPYSFAAHDAVKMASDRSKLARAVGRRLRELPGGRSGWYRNAATGLREDGSTTSKLGQASVTLTARKGDVILRSRGGLQRVHPQSKKLEPLDTGKDGVPASKGVIYVIGDLHFTID